MVCGHRKWILNKLDSIPRKFKQHELIISKDMTKCNSLFLVKETNVKM